ncbi:hypothetical protein CEXT_414441 [Caerostris extrusa]|uniref:Uncharacterized protein n=1 Tax=Caerostris extrusa TaxID=172846 RepID=A0AAV4NRF8_CAEEX|nr:hypothetical protein CEXT_414441 [Caerostris extrusa]
MFCKGPQWTIQKLEQAFLRHLKVGGITKFPLSATPLVQNYFNLTFLSFQRSPMCLLFIRKWKLEVSWGEEDRSETRFNSLKQTEIPI